MSKHSYILSTNKKESFPDSVKKGIKLLAYSYDDIVPYGSYIYKAQPYPSDVDAMEVITECCGLQDSVKKISDQFKKIIKRIKRKEKDNVYFGDIKAGIDILFFDLFETEIKDNFNAANIRKIIKKLYEEKLLNKKEYSEMIKIANKKKINNNDYEDLKNLFREKYIVRWKPNEILSGKKMLSGKRIITWEEAIQQPTMTKIDILVPINGKYVEMTNLYILYYCNKKSCKNPNILNFDNKFYVESLKKEVEKYSSNYYLKPFKLAKRMFSLSRFLGDKNTSLKLIELFHTDYGKLSQIASELGTLSLILTTVKKPNMKIIKNQLDSYKKDLSTIIDTELDLNMIDTVLTAATHDKLTNKQRSILVDDLQDYITKVVSEQTKAFLIKNNLFPPPENYLPQK